MKQIFFALMISILFSCETNVKKSRDDTINQSFRSLFETYDFLVRPSQIKDKNPLDLYKLKESVYNPELLGLTMSLYQYKPCAGGCWEFYILYISNDTISFSLPLTDEYVYCQLSSGTANKNIETQISLERELNSLFDMLNIKENRNLQIKVLDKIMYFNNTPKLWASDKCKYSKLDEYILGDNSFSDSCKKSIKENVQRIKKELEYDYDSDVQIYGGGILIYLISLPESVNDHLKIETLNSNCCSAFLL